MHIQSTHVLYITVVFQHLCNLTWYDCQRGKELLEISFEDVGDGASRSLATDRYLFETKT